MGFWIRYLVFGIVLAVAAYFLLVNKEMLKFIVETFSGGDEPVAEQMVDTPESENKTIEEKPKVKAKKSTNAAAEGLSRFYASINPNFDDNKGPRIRENIVYLPAPKGDLTKILQARKKVTRPLRKNWRGDTSPRPFRAGETLYQKLSEYLQSLKLCKFTEIKLN